MIYAPLCFLQQYLQDMEYICQDMERYGIYQPSESFATTHSSSSLKANGTEKSPADVTAR